jgi:hypothetical protein
VVGSQSTLHHLLCSFKRTKFRQPLKRFARSRSNSCFDKMHFRKDRFFKLEKLFLILLVLVSNFVLLRNLLLYRVIINDCLIAVGVGDVVECAASFITCVRLVSPIGGATGGSEICLLVCLTLRWDNHL